MKNVILIVFAVFLFSMCNSNKSADAELQVKNDSLERVVLEKDSTIYSVLGTFYEIENNLETIKSKEQIITATVTDVEDKRTREQKINEDINMIYQLMQENQDKVAKLQKQLQRANIKNNDLQNIITALQAKLEEKNAEILELRKNLLDMNLKIDELTYTLDTLTFDNEVKTAIIKAQDESLHLGYYLFGTEKELMEMKVLNKKGGFIGMGAVKNLDEGFNKDYFQEIDIRSEKVFKFDQFKKINIVTTHPAGSYTVYGEKPVDSLVINNVQEFWSVSKYLLIVID
jgi:hypothetical protein